PCSLAYIISSKSGGRARLPTNVVRMRSVLRFMTVLLRWLTPWPYSGLSARCSMGRRALCHPNRCLPIGEMIAHTLFVPHPFQSHPLTVLARRDTVTTTSQTSRYLQTATEHNVHIKETQHGGIRTPGQTHSQA